MAHEPLILVANPGGASRKYSFIRRGVQIAHAHIEQIRKKIVMHLDVPDTSEDIALQVDHLDNAFEAMLQVLVEKDILNDEVTIDAIAVRVIAPSAHFLEDRIITNKEISLLQTLREYAPLQIGTVLQELELLRAALPHVQVIGVSDSAFHATKPDYTWNYGIRLDDADTYDIKRFGYNGIAVESVIKQIKQTKFAPYSKVVVCHLGYTTSVTAVYNGKSIDTTTGYSPNEGVLMGTGSGTVEFSAGLALAKHKNISPEELINELNAHSGLLGISGASSDIRELLKLEAAGNHRAELALCMYVYTIRQAIARMSASLQGIDMLVFTGTIGQRSAPIRSRIVAGLEYINIVMSKEKNSNVMSERDVVALHPRTRSKPVLIVPSLEEKRIAARARILLR